MIFVRVLQTYVDLGIKSKKYNLAPAYIAFDGIAWEKSLQPMGDELLFTLLSRKLEKPRRLN